MSMEYCAECDKLIDTDFDAEHFDEHTSEGLAGTVIEVDKLDYSVNIPVTKMTKDITTISEDKKGSDMKYNQKLPTKVEKALDEYIERVKSVKYFSPSKLSKSDVDKQINITLEAFGIKAGIEYRCLKTPDDWDAAWDAAWGATWDAAWGATWDAAWGATWGAARDATWGAADLLASMTPKELGYSKKYPNGNFLQLFKLWEMGLYPCGVIDGKFICYVPNVPEASGLFNKEVYTTVLDVIINGVKYVPEVNL